MQTAIETRELISVNVDGICLRGTYHKAGDQGTGSRPGLDENRIGVLFLNSRFMPRASGGNAAVDWTDSFAKCGYPSFRFDLPGLGDSYGDLPIKALDLAHLVSTGYYAPFVSATTKNLTERFNLSGVVLMGHCAGAVSAIYAAAESKHVKGVIALDPCFYVQAPEHAEIQERIRRRARGSKLGGELTKVYRRLQKLRLFVKRNALPGNANLPLIRCWSQVASIGVPMLILNARAAAAKVWEFDYLADLQKSSGPRSRVAIKFIEGCNHSFADGLGAVRRHTEQWLHACFPLIERDKIAALSQRQGA
jgi:pimeloyl-ACP methyl ester carboxylesterase